ncbi:MAG: class II glutamine amidotransferase [Gammaproteobacteria bacterium]|nr:MAG: class II glutamine amidotransferase [Gammaproteobacteria bacterium]
MCRFVFYQGAPIRMSELLTEPDHSLINQSFGSREREEPLNGDGFGVAWFAEDSHEPALFRSVSPAWSNRNLQELARVVSSSCFLAHVRAATQGFVSETNCHPFRRGRLVFMHNGDVGGFDQIRRPLLSRLSNTAFDDIDGRTDSEHVLALIQDTLAEQDDDPSPVVLLDALRAAIDSVRELTASFAPHEFTYLNAVLTDGDSAVICRYTDDDPERGESLYVNEGRRFVCEDGLCRMLDPGEGGGVLLVASEPLSDEPGWRKIDPNSALLVQDGHIVDHIDL